jgi:membrane protein YqaA with SNARE-associated domain
LIRALYDWTMRLAARPRATYALGAVSFAESSFFPIPPDALLLPMVLARPKKAWWLAFVCTAASVAGAVAGYFIGALLFESVARPILALYGYGDKFAEFAAMYNEWGAWIVLIGGLTPFPFKVVTIASGATGFNLLVFVLSAVVARGLRFFLVAGLLRWVGPPIRDFIERRLGLVFTLGVVLLIGGFAAIRFIH